MSTLISHNEFLKSFCKRQCPHKSVNLFFTLVIVTDKLTDLWGSRLLQHAFKNTLCEINTLGLRTQRGACLHGHERGARAKMGYKKGVWFTWARESW